MKTLSRSFVALLLLIATSFVVSAQQDDVLSVDTSLVRLNIGVVDAQGNPITNLNQQKFSVYEDGVKQKVVRFEPTVAPFSLVMLLDVSGSTKSFRQLMAQAATRFADTISPQDRVAVITFNNKTEVLTDFTTNRQNVLYAISLVNSQKKGGDTMFYTALETALNKLKKESNRRKAIVVLTDGVDTEFEVDDRRTVSAANATTAETAVASIKPDQNPKLNRVLDAADRQGITVYPLALPSGDPQKIPDPLPFQVAKYTAARERLQIVANRTGGSLNTINRLEEMSRLYAQVAAELRTLYTIEYEPAIENKRDGKWRTIKLEVNRPELVARTRPGYYAK